MPGGICASSHIKSDVTPDIFGDLAIKCCGARRANLVVNYRRMRFNIELAGVYDTDLIDVKGRKINSLEGIDNYESLKLKWTLQNL